MRPPWEDGGRGPLEALFHACLLLLGSVIAIEVALALLGDIWPYLVGGGVLIGLGGIWWRIQQHRRRDW